MPRKPRFYIRDIPVHAVQRGNNKSPIFFAAEDYITYLDLLTEGAEQYGCQIHAYVLMTNHVHILMTPADETSIGLTIQHVGRRYVPYFNHSYGRTGTLWEGRYKASVIDSDQYLLTCMRYIELNPIRAAMVKHQSDYRWSSFGFNGYGRNNSVITPHPLYLSLARVGKARRQAYRNLFKSNVDTNELNDIRAAWQTGTPLGNDRFRQKIEKKLKLKVGFDRQGRPKRIT